MPDFIIDDFSVPHPTKYFQKLVQDGKQGRQPTRFIIEGDLDTCIDLVPQAANLLNTMRRVNVQNLPVYGIGANSPQGYQIRCNLIAGQETVRIYSPMLKVRPRELPKPPPRRKRAGPFSPLMPAFEAVDANGNFIGLVLCVSGTWEPPYIFMTVPVDPNTGKPRLNPFGYENWPAGGPTGSPTDKGLSWDGSTKPFSGELPYKGWIDPVFGQLTDVPARGESVPQLNTIDNEVHIITIGPPYVSATFAAPPSPAGAATWAWWSQDFVYDVQSDITRSLKAAGVSLADFFSYNDVIGSGNQILYGQWYIGVIYLPPGYAGGATLPATLGEGDGVNSWTVKYAMNDLYFNKVIPIGQWNYPWGTITNKQMVAIFWGRQTAAPVNATAGSSLGWVTTAGVGMPLANGDWSAINQFEGSPPTQYIQEQININGQTYIITPVSVLNSSFQRAINVYPRYCDNNTFLISIQRGIQISPPLGADVAVTPTKWQYGIYRPGAGGGWTFPTEFPVAVTDSSSPIFGAHVISGVKGTNINPIYCLGTFRLVAGSLVQPG